ncbi:MAG: alpha/beta fold hydrolase [Desulfobacteraceae bacterium]
MENIVTIVIRYTVYICIGYMLVVGLVFVLQRNLLYFPEREKPSAGQLAAVGLEFWPDASDYKGFMGANTTQAKGTVIVFHGNAGSAWHRYYVARALEPLGYRVILAEYPGYGGRSGKLTEKSLVADAGNIISLAQKEFGGPIYLFGESMGCGVAAAAAKGSSTPICGLVLVTPWDSLPSLAQTHYWYLPARWLVKDRFDSVSNLRSFHRPVAVAMAENDEVIPNRHTTKLYDALRAPKRIWRFQDAGHNSWPTGPEENWWREAMGFVATAN